MDFVTRAYNKIKLSQNGQNIIKTSNTQRLQDEIGYYKKLRDNYEAISRWFPRLTTYTISDQSSLHLEFFNYNNLYAIWQQSGVDHYSLRTALEIENILSFMSDCRLYSVNFEFGSDEEISRWSNNLKKMYLDKTISEYNNLKYTREFKPFCKHKKLIINGVEYYNFDQIKEHMEKYINTYLINPRNTNICIIHGDMCLGNILSTYMKDECAVSLKFIDPRGSFGEPGCMGDQRYDWAKIYHSIYGRYESIVNDEFKVEIDENAVEYKFTDNLVNLQKVYDKFFFSQYDNNINHIKFICGLVFVGMVARHYDDLSRQYVMYCTGIKMLNEVLYS